MNKTAAWISSFRLRTLPLALSSILMGSFLAASDGAFQWNIFGLCIATTIFLQILSNVANDYGDSIHGADRPERKGPLRAVQSGVISAPQMRNAVIVFTILSLASGISLIRITFGTDMTGFLTFLALGLLCIFGAIAYTVGKKPYGYAGLGDLSVLIFFGLVGVLGSYYLFTQNFGYRQLLPAISCGLFSMAVLNINNIRDIESDRLAGKKSIPARIGREKAVLYHWALILGGIAAAVAFTILHNFSPWQWLFLLTLPLFVRNAFAVQRQPATALDPYLKQMAISTLLFVVTFGTGLLIGR